MGLVSAGNGFSTPNAIAGAISKDPAQAGAAAGMLGFLQMTFGAFGGIGYVLNETQVSLPLAIGMLMATMTALYFFTAAKTSDSGSSSSSFSQ
jgi:hypothetical protein